MTEVDKKPPGLPEEVPEELRMELGRLQRQIKVLLNNYQVILKGQLGSNVCSHPENNFLFFHDHYFATGDDNQTLTIPKEYDYALRTTI